MQDLPVPSFTPESTPTGDRLRFGPFTLDPATGELWRDGERIALQPQPARLLQFLAESSGRMVTRRELQERVWGPETSIDAEHGLNYCILQVRRALGDEAERPACIETIPRRGYRFLLPTTREPRHTPSRRGRSWRSLWPAGVVAAWIRRLRRGWRRSGPPPS